MTGAPSMTEAMSNALSQSSQQILNQQTATTEVATTTEESAIAATATTASTTTEQTAAATTTTEETTATTTTEETTATTTTEEVAPAQEPSAFDLLSTTSTATTTETNAGGQTVDYKAKYEEVSSILSDPEMAELIRIKKAGGSLVDFAKQYTPVDFTKKTTAELIQIYGESNNWTKEQIESDIEALSTKSNLEQQSLRKIVEGELLQKQQDKFKTLVADTVKPLQQEEALVNKSIEKIEALSKVMPGKDMYGVMKLTDKHAESFKQFCMNPPTTMPDGTVNEHFLYAAWLGMEAFPELHKTLRAENKTLGMIEVLKTIQRATGDNAAVRTTIPADTNKAPSPPTAKELSTAFHNRWSN